MASQCWRKKKSGIIARPVARALAGFPVAGSFLANQLPWGDRGQVCRVSHRYVVGAIRYVSGQLIPFGTHEFRGHQFLSPLGMNIPVQEKSLPLDILRLRLSMLSWHQAIRVGGTRRLPPAKFPPDQPATPGQVLKFPPGQPAIT